VKFRERHHTSYILHEYCGYWCIQVYKDFDDEQERRSRGRKPIIAAVSVGFVIVGLVILAVGCYAYRKHK